MIRFILKKEFLLKHNGLKGECFFTIDNDLQAFEKAICSGGIDEDAFERTHLIGVEVIEEKKP